MLVCSNIFWHMLLYVNICKYVRAYVCICCYGLAYVCICEHLLQVNRRSAVDREFVDIIPLALSSLPPLPLSLSPHSPIPLPSPLSLLPCLPFLPTPGAPEHLWDPLWTAWVPLARFRTPLGVHWLSFAIILAVMGYLWGPFGHLGLLWAVFQI